MLTFDGRTERDSSQIGDSTRAGIYGAYLLSNHAALQGEIYVGHIEKGRSIGDPLINHTTSSTSRRTWRRTSHR